MKKAALPVLALALCLAACAAGTRTAHSYPAETESQTGWTGESDCGPNNPRHAQMDRGAGFLHLVADNGGNVYYLRAADGDILDWGSARCLDLKKERKAADPYVEAAGSYVVVSWKELVGSTWALALAVSADRGETWATWADPNPACNNYEAHVAFAGNKVHAAYVSDYDAGQGRRNEVYYRRFSAALVPEAVSCPSGQLDGTAASFPCLEAASASAVNVFYQHGGSAPHPIYESCTADAGVSWVRSELIPTGGCVDLSHPEVGVWMDGADRRKMVVASGANAGSYEVWYRRYINSKWDMEEQLVDKCTVRPYPQIATCGSDILVVYRQAGESLDRGVAGKVNRNSGVDAWSHIEGLFYSNLSFDDCGSVDCCSDGTRFYAASAGTGAVNRVLTKREDTQDPTVVIADPGAYHNADFAVTAAAADDFGRSADWLLSPSPEHYDAGILHADYFYRKAGAPGWTEWPGGARDADAPWSRNFPGATVKEGAYDFRVTVEDTAGHVAENVLTGVIVDRTPPVDVRLQISPPDGEDGWYVAQPKVGPSVLARDVISGVKATYYRFDGAADWTVYAEPFDLLEGEHAIGYYAEDNAGNASAAQAFSYKADFTDPRGEIVSPPPGEYFQMRVAAEVSCADAGSGVAAITWLVDGAPLEEGPEAKADLDISGLVDGQHSLQAEIRDRAGRKCRTQAVLFYKDTTPPSVRVEEPTGLEWVRGIVAIKADITDNLKVGRAEFRVDGARVDGRTSAPWLGTWDTSTAVNGYHVVQVEAWDEAGNHAEHTAASEVAVYVGNNISETNHFAEGCTRPGFDTWLCLQNPGSEAASVTVNYYLGEGQGTAAPRTYSLPPHSRSTIYVNGEVGTGKDVSIQVTSSRPIVSERPMYFDYAGAADNHWKGCHVAQGAHFPRSDWYFAEGCTRTGFDTWLCLQNPEGREAGVRVEYMMENGASLQRYYRVAPWSRGTVLVNGEVGSGHDVSMHVSSDVPIVAERPVYFLYQGMWDGGHNVMGAARPETEWFFAEGCTRTGFNQWLCLQNPNEEATLAEITYVMEDGGRIEREYRLEPRSRFTVNVNNDVARQHDVSACVTSELPIVAERPMYFLYDSRIDEGSNAMGVCRPGSSWYLAEGCTRSGFEEYICLLNPGEAAAEVVLRFMLEDTSQREHTVRVPPSARVTVRVNDVVGSEHDVSCEVMSDRPVVVERPMYSMYGGAWPSGDTLSGYTFNP
ncbi:MAG: Ig-like domain-containing protein [Actinomycetota bacterium]